MTTFFMYQKNVIPNKDVIPNTDVIPSMYKYHSEHLLWFAFKILLPEGRA